MFNLFPGISQGSYHTNYPIGRKYTATSGIMLGQMLMSFVIATFISRVAQRKGSNPISLKDTLITGICNTGSVYLGNNALRYCSYLVLALVKSSKILSILMVTLLLPIEKETITFKKFMTALVTTIGIVLFNIFSVLSPMWLIIPLYLKIGNKGRKGH
jgi:hypothetical protein